MAELRWDPELLKLTPVFFLLYPLSPGNDYLNYQETNKNLQNLSYAYVSMHAAIIWGVLK